MKKKFIAEKKELDNVIKFINSEIEKDVDKKTLMKIDVVIEEIFVNIASYAYKKDEKGFVDISIKNENNKIIISFEDMGVPFNPLLKENPDVTLSAENREPGGLGIYMMKKMMDNVEYIYKDNKNILVIEKNIDMGE